MNDPEPTRALAVGSETQERGETMPIHLVERGLVVLFFCTLCAIASTAWSDEVPRRVLLIQDAERPEGSEFLADSLRKHQLSVDVQPSGQLLYSLNEL